MLGVRARTLRMEFTPYDLPPLPRRKITIPLSTLAEVARDVCDGYDPPARGRAYAKAHPLWRELPTHLHALMNALVSVCRGRVGELTLTSSASLGSMIGRSARTVRRQDGPPPARPDRRRRAHRHRSDPRRRALGRADQGGRDAKQVAAAGAAAAAPGGAGLPDPGRGVEARPGGGVPARRPAGGSNHDGQGATTGGCGHACPPSSVSLRHHPCLRAGESRGVRTTT